MIVQAEEIRTLPHSPESPVIFLKELHEIPMKEIRRTVEKDRPQTILKAGGEHGIEILPLPPDLGIPEIGEGKALRKPFLRDHRISLLLHKLPLYEACDALRLPDDLLSSVRNDSVSRIHEHRISLPVQGGTPGKAAALIGFIRRHSRSLKAPVNEIRRAPLPPVHSVPVCAVRIVLIEQVVPSPIEGKAIRIIQPACPRREMIERPLLRRDFPLHPLLIFSCLL